MCCNSSDDRATRRPPCQRSETTTPSDADCIAAGFGPDGAPIVGSLPDRRQVARVELSNGNVIDFVAIQSDDAGHPEISVREMTAGHDASRLTVSRDPALSPLDLFRNLAPTLAVPTAIAAYAREGQEATDTVEAHDNPIEADLDELDLSLRPRGHTTSSGFPSPQYCKPGGTEAFYEQICASAVYPDNTWRWCDEEPIYSTKVRYTNGHRRRKSTAFTAACIGPGLTEHFYRSAGGGWKPCDSLWVPAGYTVYSTYHGTIKRDRKVLHRPISAGVDHYVRAATFIYNL